jgi:plastocyanin domain-containing protein
MRHWLKLLFAVAGIGALFVSVVSGEEPAKQEKVFRAIIDADGVQRVDVLGGGYFFSPHHIVVKVNTPVELKVRKEPGIVPHDIVLKAPEAGIDFSVSLETEPKVIRFTPTKTGSYPFYCDKKLLFFESHREKGMEGILEVVQ